MPGGQVGPVELSLLLTDDDAQQILNTKWRHKDSTTNVLSFPAIEPFADITGFIGDISMARETLQCEAEDLDKDFSEHFTHLLIHGFLHCLGYDHETEKDAAEMEGLETLILDRLGIANPYEDN